jgi:hypothetical protein
LAGTASPLDWFDRTAGSTLREVNLQLKNLHYKALFDGICYIYLHISPTRTKELKAHTHTEPHMGGRHTYDKELPSDLKG